MHSSPLAAPRLSLAIAGARCAATASSLLGRGGTSLPGLVSLRIDPNVVQRLVAQLGEGAVVVAGTNGKTTTSALTAAALRLGGRRVVHNRAGSNMLRGVATTLARRTSLTGRVRSGAALSGLFEVDEAALPKVLEQVQPRVVLITNLFRDQLDRYGELAAIAGLWRAALRALPSTTTLVLNADDPLVASLAADAPGSVHFFGIDQWPSEELHAGTVPAGSADSTFCPVCGEALRFSQIAYAHLGRYACPACGFARPDPDVYAGVVTSGATGSVLAVRAGSQHVDTRLRLPGRYNAYNAVAAIATAIAAGVALPVAGAAVAAAHGAFGRAEAMSVSGRSVRLFLIKNPTGADEVLRVVAAGDKRAGLLVLLSDNAADGHDVSWIWDAQFELLAEWSGPVYCGGTRAEDMALRLKYAALPGPWHVISDDVGRAVDEACAATPVGGSLVILATYTAMLAARDRLAKGGHVAQYWRRG